MINPAEQMLRFNVSLIKYILFVEQVNEQIREIVLFHCIMVFKHIECYLIEMLEVFDMLEYILVCIKIS